MHQWVGQLLGGDDPCMRQGCGQSPTAAIHRGGIGADRLDCESEPCGFYTSSPEKLVDHINAHAADVVASPVPAVQAWDSYSAQVRDTIVRKSAGYGDAWLAQGYMGNLARVLSKSERLKNMLWRDADDPSAKDYGTQQETIQDTIVDLAALCAFMLDNVEEGNRWGR